MSDGWIEWFSGPLRIAAPLMLVAMGGLWSERSGVINISLEGKMLFGAFFGAVFAHLFKSPCMAILGGIFGGWLMAVVYSFAAVSLRANQIVAGTAINFLAMGLVPVLSNAWFQNTTSTPVLVPEARLTWEPFLCVIGVVVGSIWFLKRSYFGLWVKAAGENPDALSAAGISIRRVRMISVWIAGAFAGMGGMLLSTYLSSSFTREMTAGRGFIALAALILGKWRPVPTLLACLFFGLIHSLQFRLQTDELIQAWLPSQLLQTVPYLVTLIVLAGWVGRSRAPQSLGLPH